MKVNIGKFPKDEKEERFVRIKIENHDVFNLDETLSLVICASLKKFKEKTLSVPMSLVSDDENEPSYESKKGGMTYWIKWFTRLIK